MKQELRLVSSELIEVESHPGKRVFMNRSEYDGMVALQPDEARQLASMLTAAADFAEGTTAT